MTDATQGAADRPAGQAPTERRAGTESDAKAPRRSRAVSHALWLAGLVVLADWLFWDAWPGLSLALFGLALGAGMLALVPAAGRRDRAVAAAILIASLLPVVEQLQTLSVLFLVAGLLGAATVLALGSGRSVPSYLRGAGCLLALIPVALIADGVQAQRTTSLRVAKGWWRRAIARFALPVVAGAGLVALLIAGNPILDLWLTPDWAWLWQFEPDTGRLVFWLLIALGVWPLLSARRLRNRAAKPARPAADAAPRLAGALINPASVANALILFNLIFAVQSATDLTYLWGHATLPAGLSFAEYAHRGAYTLVGTALLAGAFALVARPFTTARPGLRLLLALWLGQNLLLVLSSLYRLDLYVDAYGLTRLRLAAAIWMALVFGGLALTAWQIARHRSNGWLFDANAVMLAGVLYACCFVNGSQLVATVSLNRAEQGAVLDAFYLCRLGPSAAPALIRSRALMYHPLCVVMIAEARQDGQAPWREWGFRPWRIGRYVEEAKAGRQGLR